MNHFILLLGLIIISTFSKAKTPPAAVANAFNQKFTTATKVKWSKENATEWEANFSVGDTKVSANFSTTGQWMETETEIPSSQLPTVVASAIKSAYPTSHLVSAYKIESTKSGTHFEAEIKTGMKKREVLYKEDGTFLK